LDDTPLRPVQLLVFAPNGQNVRQSTCVGCYRLLFDAPLLLGAFCGLQGCQLFGALFLCTALH
jgi:hypothetical protein